MKTIAVQSTSREAKRGTAHYLPSFTRSVIVGIFIATLASCGGGGGDHDKPTTPTAPEEKYSAIPTPTVTGPIKSESFASQTKNYTFFATDMALSSRGYVEEEFFFEGKANWYAHATANINGMGPIPPSSLPTDFTVTVAKSDVPYKTRMVVRRPASTEKFNGTVVVEWLNVTDNFDGEYFWVQAKDHLIREGYAYIGISAQRNGITNTAAGLGGLIGFSSTRYGSLDVTNGGAVPADHLSYDIFSQAAKAAYAVPVVLGGMKAKHTIGIGMSQSAGRLAMYINYIDKKTPIYEGFIMQVWPSAVRDDLRAPLIKVLSESEAMSATNLNSIQPDIPLRHTWYVAGTSHGDVFQRMGRTGVRMRDYGVASTPNDSCPATNNQTRPRTPYRHVLNAAVYHIQKQIETGAIPPSAPPFQTTGSDTSIAVARDSNDNALGAIRLAHMEVPTATVNGTLCGNPGPWVPFDDAKLNALYTSHADYVNKVATAVNASIAAGFVLPEDGKETIAEAEASIYGLGLNCGLYCLNVGHFKVDFSSTGLLREHTVYYNIVKGDNIMQAVNNAHWYTAKGYSSTGSTAANYFNSAVSELQYYISLVVQARAEERLTPTAATLLTNEANAIIQGLEPLP